MHAQMLQQGLYYREQQQQWSQVVGGMYAGVGDGMIRPNLLECGFGSRG